MAKVDPFRDRFLSALLQVVGHEVTEGHIGNWKEEALDAFPTLVPAALPLDDVKRHALEGALRGLIDRAKRMGTKADESWFKGELAKALGKSGGERSTSTHLVDGLTAIGGMSEKAKAAYEDMVNNMKADAALGLIDRLQACKTTPQTLEPAFVMQDRGLRLATLERILAKIEQDAAEAKKKAEAEKAAGDPVTRMFKRIADLAGAGKVTQAGVDALKAHRLAQEEKDLRRRYPKAVAALDDPAQRAALLAYAETERLNLTRAYRAMNNL